MSPALRGHWSASGTVCVQPVRREQTTLPSVIAINGGVPIKVGNEVIGGIGLSGSPGKDEECVLDAA